MSEAGISTERQGVLVRALFKVLLDNPNGLSGREALAGMWNLEPPTLYESGYYPSQPRDIRGNIATRFFTVNCVKAGWMEKSASVWTLTEEGVVAYRQFPDPGDFARECLKRYNEWKNQQGDEGSGTTNTDDGETIGEDSDQVTAAAILETAREDAWAEIVRYLGKIDPYDFQQLIAGLLEAMGYHVAYISPPGPDRGLDILAFTDPLGTEGPRIKVQAKRRTEKTTVEGFRSFLSLIGSSDAGIYISAGGFTSEAEKEARFAHQRVMLIDLEKLVSLWISNIEKIDPTSRSLLPLVPVWYLTPEA